MMAVLKPQYRRWWLLAVCAAVLLQSMYPAGYMPTRLADGWPVMLCPDGMPAGFVDSGHAGHHQHGDQDKAPQASDSCPVGKAFESQVMLLAEAVPAGVTPAFNQAYELWRTAPVLRLHSSSQPRAPPFSDSV